MKVHSIKKALIYGLIIWLIPFLGSMLIYPIRENQRVLFESIMPVFITFAAIELSIQYFKRVKGDLVKEALIVGFVWLLISIGIDLLLFMWGPMKMSFLDYMMDIGTTYFIIPIITTGMGLLIRERKRTDSQ